MALVVKDRVRETSTSTGTGPVALNGAVQAFQDFTVIGDGNTTYYTIVDAQTGDWEVGIGTYTLATTTLSRDTVLESSNAGNLVNFAANVKDVFVTYPAERSVYVNGSAIVPATTSRLGFANLAQGDAFSVLGVSGNAQADVASISAASDYQVLRRSGASIGFGAIALNQSGAVTGTLAVGNGGTGATTLTGYVKGTGTAALTASSTIPNTDITGLGTMSTQNAGTVAITGGTINGTTIGATTPSTGAFTSLTSSSTTTLNGTTIPASKTLVDTNSSQTLTNKAFNGSIGATTPSTGAFTNFSASGTAAFTSTGALKIPVGTVAQRPTPSSGMLRFNDDSDEFEGYNGTAWVVVGSNAGLFRKNNQTIVAWTKTGAFAVSTSSQLSVEVNGYVVIIPSATAVTMPASPVNGTDYAIWAKPDGTLEATSNHTSPPVANARKVGGFHYAPGGNATGTSGGNTTAQINQYSFWDLKFRPSCPDPRGMTLVADGFWIDIYLTGVDAITNGSSKYNVTMADGSSPPKVPTMFGGNGSTTYGSYTWFEAMELATAFGKRCPTQQEFMSAAYGTTEASSIGTDQVSTILNAAYTSKWGVIQATGVLWVWGRDRGGAYNTGGWNANTEGRGSEYNAPNAALFGGVWHGGAISGSRCSIWNGAASVSADDIGSRFVCDHLQLD